MIDGFLVTIPDGHGWSRGQPRDAMFYERRPDRSYHEEGVSHLVLPDGGLVGIGHSATTDHVRAFIRAVWREWDAHDC